MRYGYQDMPDGYTDVDPDAEEPMTTSPVCLNCGSPQDFQCNICNDCSTEIQEVRWWIVTKPDGRTFRYPNVLEYMERVFTHGGYSFKEAT